jgi:hypothetical protein
MGLIRKGMYGPDTVPPAWFATGHRGLLLQRRPEGWTARAPVPVTSMRKVLAKPCATLGSATRGA